jgi:hypothetical protein
MGGVTVAAVASDWKKGDLCFQGRVSCVSSEAARDVHVFERDIAREGWSVVEPSRATSGKQRQIGPAPPASIRKTSEVSCSLAPLFVLKIDNAPRVRDGYIRLGTRGHARARSTRFEAPICRKNVTASARTCSPVPPSNLHGKEGIDHASRRSPNWRATGARRSICGSFLPSLGYASRRSPS